MAQIVEEARQSQRAIRFALYHLISAANPEGAATTIEQELGPQKITFTGVPEKLEPLKPFGARRKWSVWRWRATVWELRSSCVMPACIRSM